MKSYTISEIVDMFMLNHYDVYNHIRLNRSKFALKKAIIYGRPKKITAEGILIIIKHFVDPVFYEKCEEHFKNTGYILKLKGRYSDEKMSVM